MFIKQISVFLENVRGTVSDLTVLLGNSGIDLLALSIADTANFGIVRCIASGDQTDTAVATLRGNGYTARATDVICVCVPDSPGGLAMVLKIIDSAGISVEYLYSLIRQTEGALIVFKLSDQEAGLKVLAENNIKIISQDELNNL